MFLAVRNLLQDRTRFALSVAGVALAVMLILILGGFLSGMFRQISAYLDGAPGSVVVAQDGVRNLLGATSLLPAGAYEAVNGEQGVVGVAPVLSQFVILELHGRKQPAYLVGYEPSLGGGPARMAVGSEPRSDDELVFDRALAARHGLRIGDAVDLTGREFTIVGLSEGTTSWMLSFVFLRKSAAEAILRSPGASSFLFVTADGVVVEDLRERLARVPGTEALMKEEMRANDLRLWGKIFSAPLRLMTGIAFLVGTLVVGLVIYTATVERQAEYGVLKAIGAPNRALYRVVVAQALLAAASGAAAGVVLAFAVAELIMALRPQFLLAVEPAAIVQALAAGLGMALLAALFPARLMARLAPADVFRR